ncbi:substrate-binding periplasmic protein [Desulfohalovibrio reitneri]|uniref:substrate-binding periplasmic protein n=1 Tax=Desulfohalovibrio reitneri TaxID=1307759 RepID=UPI00110E2AA2|nr:transporter substrate-binding domain-containing protein [Desulfohalovibrio reitneri]
MVNRIAVLCLALWLASFSGTADADTPPHDPGASEFVINSSYSPPFSTPDGEGYFDKVVREAFRRAGLRAKTRMMPAERSLRDAASGMADGDVGRMFEVAGMYPQLVLVSEPVLPTRRFVAFASHAGAAMDPPGWQGLGPWRVGYVNGWKIFEKRAHLAREAVAVDNLEQLFTMLGKGRIDLALCAETDGLLTARRLGLSVRVLRPPLAEMPMYLLLNKAHAGTVERLEQVLRFMRLDGTLKRFREETLPTGP